MPDDTDRILARRKRRNHSAAFIVKVALEALKDEKTLAEIADQFDVHANQVSAWKARLLDRAVDVFDNRPTEPAVDIKTLHAKIGELTLENDFLQGALIKAGYLSAKK